MTQYMEDRELPIRFESIFAKLPGMRYGEIIRISPRTAHSRSYTVRWENGEIKHYKGGAARPDWIKHILRSQNDKSKE